MPGDPVTCATTSAPMASTGHTRPIKCNIVLDVAAVVIQQHSRPGWTSVGIITRIIYSGSEWQITSEQVNGMDAVTFNNSYVRPAKAATTSTSSVSMAHSVIAFQAGNFMNFYGESFKYFGHTPHGYEVDSGIPFK